jgi:hypothetical protein
MKLGGTVYAKIIIVLITLALAVVGFLIVRPALAQEDASSTDAASPGEVETTIPTTTADTIPDTGGNVTSDQTTSASTSGDSNQAVPTADAQSSSAATTNATSSVAAVEPLEPAPEGLTEVHIIGTKYIDYFTDGSTTVAYPGDPNIDAYLAEKDAPIPSHESLTWVHTTGGYLYDTPSGDLGWAIRLDANWQIYRKLLAICEFYFDTFDQPIVLKYQI